MKAKKKLPDKRSVILWLLSACTVALLLLLIFHKDEKTLQYDIVILGDSVVGNVAADGSSLTDYVSKGLGKSTFKGGLGGTGMSVDDTRLWGSLSKREWCMVKLAEAICYDDWKSQLGTMEYAASFGDYSNQAMDYFPETMKDLSQIDFSKVEILVIEHGTNDYNRGVITDNPENPYDVTTFGGALRQTLKLLKDTYPEMRIVVMSPIYCALGENQDMPSYSTKYGEGGYLDEYVELEKQIAGEFQVEWLDAYHKSGIWEENAKEYLFDSLHLNEEGHKLLGEFLAEYLAEAQ